MSFLAPAPLQPGDRVAIVAPAGPFDRPSFERGLEVIASRYRPEFSERIFDAHRYLAGTDATRSAELNAALTNPDLRAVFSARGGYGSMRLLPQLTWPSPKALIGFSDITSLHLTAQKKGWRSFHAPVLTQLGKQSPQVIDRLFAALEGRPLAPLTGTRTVTPGTVEGPLLGGNLSVLTRLLGTPWMPSLRGAILLLEDIGERPYRLDRMWTHLQLSGALEGIRGVVFGEFTNCDDPQTSLASATILDELVATLNVPCAAGFHIGHGDINEPVILGSTVRLDATHRSLEHLA